MKETHFRNQFFKNLTVAWQSPRVANWQATIERAIGDVKIYGVVHEEPRIELEGPYPLSNEQIAARDALRTTTEINDPHAMLIQEPQLLDHPVQLRAQTLDYAALEILRKENKHQHIVSASAVIVCPKAKTLIFHDRSPRSRTFPSCIHTVGGAFQPAGVRAGHFDANLRSAAEREVREEINAVITCSNSPPMLLAEELSERFFQIVFLGANISVNQLRSMKENWEGAGIVKVAFDDLRGFLVAPPKPWVPTGKAHVLAWLALGAPGAGWRPRFRKLSPRTLFDEIISLSA